MHFRKWDKIIVILYFASLYITPVQLLAQNNLIINGGAEEGTLGGLPGWNIISGSWVAYNQNLSSLTKSHSGTYFFFSGQASSFQPGLEFKLAQVVDISSFKDSIDKGLQKFVFNAYRISGLENPPDTTQITIEFLDQQNVVLSKIVLPKKWNTIDWEKDDTTLLAPSLSRYIKINLISILSTIYGNDGYFDDISLRPVVTPIIIVDHIEVFDVVTPNNDGKNDYFKIDGIENFPDNYVKVISESGQIIFEKKNYDNDWQAEDVPAGIYFYYLEAGGNKYKGKLHVIR